MTCESPFVFIEASDTVFTTESNIIMGGSVTIPSLSTPSTEICLLGWNPAHASCHWTGWRGTILSCQWDGGSHYWYDCSGLPSIEIFPEIILSGSCEMPFATESSVEIQISDIGTIPVEITSIIIADILCTANIQINYKGAIRNEPINFTIPGFTVSQENGSFSATIPLQSLNYEYSGPLLTYTINVGVNLLFCLTPIPPVGWINLQFPINIVLSGDGLPATTITALLLLPIVSVEDLPVE